MPISMRNTFFTSLMKQFYIFAFLIFLASNLMAESYVRIRGLQASPLLSSSSEKGKFKSGNSEIPLKTPPSLSQSTMISYGILGIGSSSITTTFTFSGKEYILTSEWFDGAFIFDGPGNTSLTFGAGFVSKGNGVISNQSSELTSNTVNGRSWFGVFGLGYELPVNLGFIGLEFTEILFGYRENQLEYSAFQNSSSTLSNKLKFKSIQYQFGVGFVF